jgi:hypothetical protein
LLNIEGVVQGEVGGYSAIPKKKKFRLRKRNGVASFGGWSSMGLNKRDTQATYQLDLIFKTKKGT